MKKNYYVARLICSLLFMSTVFAAACDDCETVILVEQKEPDSQTDLFAQTEAARVDILWVVDNSESMDWEQNKIADRFSQFFKQLLISQVNFHIGVITTDPSEGGVLRSYTGPSVEACSECRFITKETPCPNPDVTFNPGTSEAEIEQGLLTQCPAQLVFRKLIKVGIDGANFEEGLTNATLALGALIDPATGAPQRDAQGNRIIPALNAGFLRDDASLYLIFVSDEEDSSRGPLRYYYRLFEGLKFAGNENRIAISAITGWPNSSQGVTMNNICDVMRTSYDNDSSNDDPNLQVALDVLSNANGGCRDPEDNSATMSMVGGKVIDLSCRTGGVIADICSADYSSALDDLGANAAGLIRKFPLSKAEQIHFGIDCLPFTEDDAFVPCGELIAEEYAAPICVIATPLSGGGEVVVPKSDVTGWRYESSTQSVRFDGSFIPAPATEVRISYKLRPSTITCN